MRPFGVGAAVCIALCALCAATPAEAIRPFNPVEESAVQDALEYWGRAPACQGGFGRFIVTNEEIDGDSPGKGHHLGGYASWTRGPARDCKIVLAQRSKRRGYAAFCTTVTHEVGHLIRLDEWHSDDPADAMYSRPTPPTPQCRARELWMLAESDRLDRRASALARRCRRLRRLARSARFRRCDQRMKATRTRASALVLAFQEIR